MSTFSSDIFQSNAQNYSASKSDAGVYSAASMMNGASASQSTAQINASRALQFALSQLKAGDVLQGEVQSVQGEEVLLKLLNGELLQARLEGQMMLSLGQRLQFQVQSNEQNKIVLKPFQQALQQVGDAALKAAALPVNLRTQQLVSTLMENGMPVDKNSLTSMYRMTLSFPETSPKTLFALQQLEIPVTQDNIKQYENYKNLEYKLMDSMSEVLDEIEQVYDRLPEDEKAMFAEKVVQALEPDRTQAELETQEQLTQQETQTPSIKQQEVQDLTIRQEAQEQSIKQNVQEQPIKQETQGQPIKQEVLNQPVRKDAPEKTIIQEKQEQPIKQNAPDQSIQQENKQQPGMLEAFEYSKHHGTAERKKLFMDFVKESIQKNWMLEPKDVEDKKKIQNLYDRVQRQAREIQDSVELFGKNMEQTPKSAQNIQKNIAFMQQLDQMFNYIQLPLRMSTGKMHGDLYVMTNKKNLAKKEGELSAFLHLDMDHLGTTEVKLSLQTQQNQLRCDFYLQEDSLKLVSEHIDELQVALEKKGYHTKTSIAAILEEKTVLERMEEASGLNMTPMSYQSFDTRA